MRSFPMFMRIAKEMRRREVRSPFYDDVFHSPLRWTPWKQTSNVQHELEQEFTKPKIGKDGYQVSIDVTQFSHSELTVKAVENKVVVEGKFEGCMDEYGSVSSHFVRSFNLPAGFKADHAMSSLSSDGILTINVPKLEENKANERIIPIQQTGAAYYNVEDDPPTKVKREKKPGKKGKNN